MHVAGPFLPQVCRNLGTSWRATEPNAEYKSHGLYAAMTSKPSEVLHQKLPRDPYLWRASIFFLSWGKMRYQVQGAHKRAKRALGTSLNKGNQSQAAIRHHNVENKNERTLTR